jgi:hypothetical protein
MIDDNSVLKTLITFFEEVFFLEKGSFEDKMNNF